MNFLKKSACLSGFIAAMQLKCVHVFALLERCLAVPLRRLAMFDVELFQINSAVMAR